MTKETMKKRRSARSILLSLMIIIIALFAISCYVRSEAKNRVPANIREMGQKYPEAMEYVEGYFEYKDADLSMDVTKEMEEREIPLFIQWDKRWGYKDYGGNYIGVAGCGPTCLAMVVCGLTGDASVNPYVVATYAADSHFYKYGEGTSWDLMTKGALNYGIKAMGGENSAEFIP